MLLLIFILLFVISCLAQRNLQKTASPPQTEMFSGFIYSCNTELSMQIGRLAKTLKKKPTTMVYFISYSNGSMPLNSVLNNINSHMKESKIPQKRIIVIQGGEREYQMIEIFIVPKGGSPPIPTPKL